MKHFSDRAFRFLAVGSAAVLPSTEAAALSSSGKMTRPNVVLILADDLGVNDCAADDHRTAIYTPNLLRLAKAGVTFTEGYASASMCTPSRVGLLSGRYPARFGVYDVSGDASYTWPQEQVIFPQYFKAAGYRTGIIGKWHCGGEIEKWAYNHPLERGFDRFWGFMGSTHDYFDPTPGSGVNGAGYWSCGYNPIYDQHDVVQKLNYLTDDIAEQSVRFIRENKERPFFLYVAHHCPHVPLQVPKAVHEKYLPLGYRENTTVTRAMDEVLDRAVGLVLDELEKQGLRENTLVIFSSDNGGSERCGQLNNILRGGKFSVMEGGIRVPILMSWPGHLPEDVVFCDPVWNLDFLPTALAAVDIKTAELLEGVNLLPYLSGEKNTAPHEALFWRQPAEMEAYAVRSGDWKLVYSKLGRGLYDLKKDPGETVDVRSQYPEVTGRLQKMYDRWDIGNRPSFWNSEYQKKYLSRRTSENELENKSYKYKTTFGEVRR